MNMIPPVLRKVILTLNLLLLTYFISFANEAIFGHARSLQREGKFNEAIEAYENYLTLPVEAGSMTEKQVSMYTDALVQLMNTFQSKGEPEACISALNNVFKASPLLQNEFFRDFCSVMGYALSRTENMHDAEETMLKTFSLPLFQETPERYFRDYAYAAAVFYSNPKYQKEVINWCEDAIHYAQLCKNTSGKQWVTAMLGSVYKRNGKLGKALDLFEQSKEEALAREDDLGVLNSLHTIIDLFLYWDIPEYANLYASEAISVEKNMTVKNPMISAQTFINKGRALHQLGETDSISLYIEEARNYCNSLPYNSGMVDVDLLQGICLTEKGGESLHSGIQKLNQVTLQGTAMNRAKAYHQLAQTYLKEGNYRMAESTLDELYSLMTQSEAPVHISIEYKPIIDYYLRLKKHDKADQYVQMMLQEQDTFKEKRLNLNLVEAIVDLQTEQKEHEMEIIQLKQTNQCLWFVVCLSICGIIISVILVLLVKQKKHHTKQMQQAEEKLLCLMDELNKSNDEKDMIAQEVNDFLKDKDKRREMETLTPYILKESGETKFRQYFELLYPLFLHRLRENVPSITRREELLSMLIIMKQDNKQIAELLAIAPRSVLMLRHRLRQKIGMNTEYSLENFIDDILDQQNRSI